MQCSTVSFPMNLSDLAKYSMTRSIARLLATAELLVPCGSRRSKGVPSGGGVFLRLMIGWLGTPKLAQIFAYGKWLYPYRMLIHGASDLDQRCLKTCNSKDGCTLTIQVNYSTNHPKRKKWFNKGKEAKKSLYIYIPNFFSKQSRCILKVAIVSQLINDIGKLSHTSIILSKKIRNIQMHLWFVDFKCVTSQSCA